MKRTYSSIALFFGSTLAFLACGGSISSGQSGPDGQGSGDPSGSQSSGDPDSSSSAATPAIASCRAAWKPFDGIALHAGTEFMEIVGVDMKWSTGTSCSGGVDRERCLSDLAAMESGAAGQPLRFGVSPLSGAPVESDAFFSARVIVTEQGQVRVLTRADLQAELTPIANPSTVLWPAANAILWAAANGFAIDCPTPHMVNETEQWYLDVWSCGAEAEYRLVKRHLAIQPDGTFAGALNGPKPDRAPCAANWGG